VGCLNEDKGGIAKKACQVACIGCSKCEDVCPKDAVIMHDNLAYIDPELCTLCRKCVDVCPTHSIIETNFPPKKVKKPKKVSKTAKVDTAANAGKAQKKVKVEANVAQTSVKEAIVKPEKPSPNA
jgi:formate hydrogenlyase subunit 6/NADH:ubiquinone oxidoreductase subunit I